MPIRHCAEHFPCINLLESQFNPVRKPVLQPTFHSQRNCGTEGLYLGVLALDVQLSGPMVLVSICPLNERPGE